jgi:serine/threonine protein phosphatase PrpC
MKVTTKRHPSPGPERQTAIKAAGLTNTGKVRSHNEDAFSISEDLGLFIVSDGMGGHQAGDLASKMVAEALPSEVASALRKALVVTEGHTTGALKCAISNLSNLIHRKSLELVQLRCMGATVVACLIRSGVASIAHMGDSRAYLMRDGVLEQLTEDHTIVALMLQLGQINKKQATKHPARHTLTRHMGMEGEMGPEVGLLDIKEGDRLLLCSDGLTNEVKNREIAEILWSEPDIEAACARLIQKANDAGGRDNITVVIIQYDGSDDRSQCRKKKVVVKQKVGTSFRKKEAQAEEKNKISPRKDME